MTRRKVYFYDNKTKKLYSTPEFNGDKNEFAFFSKRGDSCDKNFDEILKEFNGVKTLKEFENASNNAQNYYHSGFVKNSFLPIEEVKEITYNDEIYVVDSEGNPYLYNPQEIKRDYILNICDRGNFKYKDFTMNVTKVQYPEKNYSTYIFKIEPIENVYSGMVLYLGDFANDEKNKYWGYEFNKNFEIIINKIETCKERLKKEPIKVELVELFSKEYKYCFKDENGRLYGLTNGGDCIFLTTLDNKGNCEGNYDDFKNPILWEDKNIYSIFLQSHNDIGYEMKHFDIPRIAMAYKLNSYMTQKEDILYADTINKNLNDIYANIYNIQSIEENFFQKYKTERDIKELKDEYYKLLDGCIETEIGIEKNQSEEVGEQEI